MLRLLSTQTIMPAPFTERGASPDVMSTEQPQSLIACRVRWRCVVVELIARAAILFGSAILSGAMLGLVVVYFFPGHDYAESAGTATGVAAQVAMAGIALTYVLPRTWMRWRGVCLLAFVLQALAIPVAFRAAVTW